MKLSTSKPKHKLSFEISKAPSQKSERSKHGFYSEFEIIKPNPNVSTYSLPSLKPGPDETLKDKCCNKNCLLTLIPILKWLPHYKLSYLKPDCMAGITVSILLVPQALAYAQLAGLPPEWGLYASVMPVILYTIWSTSTKVATGPGAPTAIMVASAVSGVMVDLGIDADDPQYEELYQSIAMTFSFVCGIIFIIFGLIRAGFIIVFLSRPVMTGFIMSAAFIILINQFRGLFGLDIDRYPVFYETLIAVVQNYKTIHLWTTLISAASLLILFFPKFYKKIPKWVPTPLIVIVLNIVISYLLDLESVGVAVVGAEIISGFPTPEPPNFEYMANVFPSAIVVTIVSFMGNIALAKGFEQKTKETYQQQLSEWERYDAGLTNMKMHDNKNNEIDLEGKADDEEEDERKMGDKPPIKPLTLPPIDVNANMEFIAYGMANLVGAFFSSQVISASFSRSALNVEMNGHSQFSSFVRVIICVFCLLFLMPLLSPLPKCVLASVVTVAVYRLIKNGVNEFKFLWSVSKMELIEFLVAVLLPLYVGLEIGIFISIGTSIITNLLRHSFASIIFLGQLPSAVSGDAAYVDCELFKNAQNVPHIKIVEMKAGLSFSNNIRLVDKLRELLADGNKYIVVSLNLTSFIDTTAIRQIVTIFEDAKTSYICFSQCRPKVIELIRRYQQSTDKFPANVKTFISTHDAVIYLQSIRNQHKKNNDPDYSSGEEEDILPSIQETFPKQSMDNYYITPKIEDVQVSHDLVPQFTRI